MEKQVIYLYCTWKWILFSKALLYIRLRAALRATYSSELVVVVTMLNWYIKKHLSSTDQKKAFHNLRHIRNTRSWPMSQNILMLETQMPKCDSRHPICLNTKAVSFCIDVKEQRYHPEGGRDGRYWKQRCHRQTQRVIWGEEKVTRMTCLVDCRGVRPVNTTVHVTDQ